jgi:hypothetical protein
MELLSKDTIHKTSHYVLDDNGIEYERVYDFEERTLQWIKDPCKELGESEVVKDCKELEKRFNGMYN